MPWHTIETLLNRISIDTGTECWIWAGCVNHAGYGVVTFEGRSMMAHRVFYSLLVEPLIDGMVIDHLCRNRACVNPVHLEQVTSGENVRRGYSAAANNLRKTHCCHGHELSGDNLVFQSKGRLCRFCRNKWSRDRYWRYSRKISIREKIRRRNRQGPLRSCNTSGYRGVTVFRDGVYYARCDDRHIGVFDDIVDAAISYDIEAIRVWGWDAITNFPLTNYEHYSSEFDDIPFEDRPPSDKHWIRTRGSREGVDQ